MKMPDFLAEWETVEGRGGGTLAWSIEGRERERGGGGVVRILLSHSNFMSVCGSGRQGGSTLRDEREENLFHG